MLDCLSSPLPVYVCSEIVAKCICANIHVAESRTTATKRIVYLCVANTFNIQNNLHIFCEDIFCNCFYCCIHSYVSGRQALMTTTRSYIFCSVFPFLPVIFFARSNRRTIRKDNMIQSEMRKKTMEK